MIVKLGDHSSLQERSTNLYRMLGYPNVGSFFMAYGYSTNSNVGCRPSKNDPEKLVAVLLERYNGKDLCKNTTQLMSDNPDLKGEIKTFANKAKAVVGMSVTDYFIQKGVLSSK